MAGSERGCPELQGSQLLWTHEACSWTAKSADYRALQELAYVNHAGVPVESIYVLMTAFPLVLMAHQSCGPLGTPAPPLAKALWDAVVVVLPLTFHFSAHLEQPLLLLLLATSILELRRCSKGGLSWQATFSLDNDRLRFVSEYRALVMMSTCVAILAVDFSSVFSRAQAKTEEFGYSLMDVGTGSIIFSSGVCTMPKRGGASRLYKIMKLWPVLLIGFVRAALMWGIDYHVPPGEYGIHWNFFFTIAVISLVSTATDLSALASATAASLALGAYQSFVPAHEEAMQLLVHSNTKASHWRNCWMDDDDLDELYEDVVDSLQRALRDSKLNPRLRSRLEGCRKVMRECDDSYCKELWDQEDRGQRRRKREESEDCTSSEPDAEKGSDNKKLRVDVKSSSPGSV